MTSDDVKEAYVWIWLPGETSPVVAGRLHYDGDKIQFNYGRSYLDRTSDSNPAIPIYEPELPLKPGLLIPPNGLSMHGCIRDASPDAWGRRVILYRKLGIKSPKADTAELNELTYLLESGSDRIGAIDFQYDPYTYKPRLPTNTNLEELLNSANLIERGLPISPELYEALLRGSSIGGARPKVLIENEGTKYIAKFESTTDHYRVVKAEFIAMRLAFLAGLNVAPVRIVQAANKDVLLIERFDRIFDGKDWTRKLMVSTLTLFGLDEMTARYASYEDFAEIIRSRFTEPKQTLKELYSRLSFNVLCGNTDDHARNHAAFYNGNQLELTPAYDICPQGRIGNEASQAMRIYGTANLSQLKTCLMAAHCFHLSEHEALDIFDHQITVIKQHWDMVCDEAEIGEIDKKFLWGRDFLNPFSLLTE